MPLITLVLGGARSGKSAYAERLVNTDEAGLYLATAEIRDDEMAERVRLHRGRRDRTWTTVEEPLNLAQALKEHSSPRRPVLVECLTIWLSNLMEAQRNIGSETGVLVETLSLLQGPVVFVSNEVGQGIIPDNRLARDFVDASGRLNQSIAMIADRVIFINAGLPTVLKEVRA
ncbi:MAG: bifunctional adenosylcobinamide kinase/adenosylcobinamide-phosphate guanylyltransferase [Rhodospirillales bacterium RIFCSPLOWO2_12_FULL_58_28]|nr:MAG: bifunctional adenosylcobinamide kinase/adenosylcobinamide-phosphate guanylyltransferase [Rhodospirillales bacterium RIFCSPLOWO2_02_FULL_58_16]OHC78007.1 MAG: bifunctional adenosylcobinamide kinase/adenosylcobinamide-phosphate guanylyltransferase [Rhodospirillales bacterium RIFCSPLOWO2_12_FULL_58_28]